jgi:predicted nucleic acid-binding protein
LSRLLLDLSVVLDVLLDREPHAAASAAVWKLVEEGKAEGLVAAHAFTTLFYLLSKVKGRAEASLVVTDLMSVFGVAPVDAAVLRRASTLQLHDFEDAVTAAAGEAAGCTLVVTRDAAGFAGAPIQAAEPLLALALLQNDIHEQMPDYEPGPRRRRR